MKCPNCNTSLSDLRDICPKCRVDLRDEKKKLGIKIVNSTATYQELLEKSASSSNLLNSIKSIFSASREDEVLPSRSRESSDDIGALFDKAFLDAKAHGSAFELSLLQLKGLDREKEELAILFDLALEAIADPTTEKRYVHDVKISEKRIVTAETAAQQLARIEAALSAPVLSMKGTGSRRASANAQLGGYQGTAKSLAQPTVPDAPISLRIKAALVDLTLVTFTAAVIAAALVWFLAPELRQSVISPFSVATLEVIPLVSLFIVSLLILLILYPMLSGPQTRGQQLFGLRVVTQRGSIPRPAQLFARACILPICGPLAAIFPSLRNPRPIHDRITRTTVREV